MSYTLRAMFPALLLSLNLTHVMPAMAADPAPAAESTPAEPVPERAPLLSREQEEAQALERQLPSQNLQQLQAGDTRFIALWRPANTDSPQGAVIILPGAGESPDWPDVVGPAGRKFPDIGWSTLSLTLPDEQPPALQAREAEPAPVDEASKEPGKEAGQETVAESASADAAPAQGDAEQVATEASAQAEAEQVFSRIESAIAFAQQNKARRIILLGHANGAYWAARFVTERPTPQVQQLVMVAAREPLNASPSLLDIIPSLKIKTADFVSKGTSARGAEQRLQVSKRTKGPGFTQIVLTTATGTSEAEQEQVFRRIRGWVQSH